MKMLALSGASFHELQLQLFLLSSNRFRLSNVPTAISTLEWHCNREGECFPKGLHWWTKRCRKDHLDHVLYRIHWWTNTTRWKPPNIVTSLHMVFQNEGRNTMERTSKFNGVFCPLLHVFRCFQVFMTTWDHQDPAKKHWQRKAFHVRRKSDHWTKPFDASFLQHTHLFLSVTCQKQ